METTDPLQPLEASVQKAVDQVRACPESMDNIKSILKNDVFHATSPSLQVWLCRVICDTTDHANEATIGLAGWTDLDVAVGLGATLCIRRHALTPRMQTLALALIELFGVASSQRLKLRAIQRLVGFGDAA